MLKYDPVGTFFARFHTSLRIREGESGKKKKRCGYGQERRQGGKETKEEKLQSLSRRRTKFKKREQEMPQQTKEELERDRGKEGDFEKKAKRRAKRRAKRERTDTQRETEQEMEQAR